MLRELKPGATGWPAAIALTLVLSTTALITYHVLLVFSGALHWRVTSAHAGYWADYLSTAIAPMRMPLLFLASGAAARLVVDQTSFGEFVTDHILRLLTAFGFAVVVLIPLQVYVRLDDVGRSVGYFDYLIHQAPFRVDVLGLSLPDFAHAWFLSYLALYALILASARRFAPRVLRSVDQAFACTPLIALALIVMGWCVLVEAVLVPRFGVTDVLIADIGGHAKYAPLFFVGALFGAGAPSRAKVLAARLPLAVLTGASMLAAVGLQWAFYHGAHVRLMADIARGLYLALAMLTTLGVAEWLTDARALPLTYATDASLPVYLLHQTTLIVGADLIIGRGWPLAIELAGLSAAAFAAPLLLYHVAIRGSPPIRVLFGRGNRGNRGNNKASSPRSPLVD